MIPAWNSTSTSGITTKRERAYNSRSWSSERRSIVTFAGSSPARTKGSTWAAEVKAHAAARARLHLRRAPRRRDGQLACFLALGAGLAVLEGQSLGRALGLALLAYGAALGLLVAAVTFLSLG